MPKDAKTGDFAPLPSTLQRSPQKAQDTYEDTFENAEREYPGDEERAHRVAWGAVKHSFEKHGDHWEPKAERGPSDERAAEGGPSHHGASYGGVDVNGKTKEALAAEARDAGIHVTSHMTKDDLGKALQKANDRATRNARS
jgi:cation transport regulator ChaB